MRGTAVLVMGIAGLAAVTAGCGSSSSSASSTSASTPGGNASAATTLAAPAAWTRSALQPGLLEATDLPTGYQVDASSGSTEKSSFTFKQDGCEALDTVLVAEQPPGTEASARVVFAGGQQGPSIEEELDGMATAKAARGFITELEAATKACSNLTMQASGVSMAADVTPLPVPSLGDKAAAAQVKVASGPLAGMTLTTVGVATGRVIVTIRYTSPTATDTTAMTKAAVEKATALGTSAVD